MRRDSKVKKTAFHFIFGRTVIVALLLLLQFALLIFLMGVVGTLTAYLTVIISAVLVVVVINCPSLEGFYICLCSCSRARGRSKIN